MESSRGSRPHRGRRSSSPIRAPWRSGRARRCQSHFLRVNRIAVDQNERTADCGRIIGPLLGHGEQRPHASPSTVAWCTLTVLAHWTSSHRQPRRMAAAPSFLSAHTLEPTSRTARASRRHQGPVTSPPDWANFRSGRGRGRPAPIKCVARPRRASEYLGAVPRFGVAGP